MNLVGDKSYRRFSTLGIVGEGRLTCSRVYRMKQQFTVHYMFHVRFRSNLALIAIISPNVAKEI